MKNLRIYFALLLIPTQALAQPVALPSACTQERVAMAGEPAQCSGILMPGRGALDGAVCIDADLPDCRAKMDRDAKASARRLALVGRDAADCEARAGRWKRLAMLPAPSLPPRVVTITRGLPAWSVAALVAVGSVFAGWLGWKAGRATR